jgi:hypothetical protein
MQRWVLLTAVLNLWGFTATGPLMKVKGLSPHKKYESHLLCRREQPLEAHRSVEMSSTLLWSSSFRSAFKYERKSH